METEVGLKCEWITAGVLIDHHELVEGLTAFHVECGGRADELSNQAIF